MPSASVAHRIAPNPDRGLSLSSLLGNDYERKKKQLQQELRLEYKHAAKIKDLKTSEPPTQPQGLLLPIEEKILVQKKLREERKKEYNLFLQEKAKIERFKRGTPPLTSKPGQVQASDAVYISSPASPLPILNIHKHIHPPPREHPASRRVAATLTEAVDNGESTGTRGPGHRRRRQRQLPKPKEPYSSEEEPITDKEEELEFRHKRRQDGHTLEPEYTEGRRTRERRANSRAPQRTKKVGAPSVRDQNNNEWVWKSDPQMPDSTRTAARSRPATSKNTAGFGTGLMIGAAEEQAVSQMKKEKYKQELLKQIAEQQRNKIREKKLELRVAPTRATDPGKQPDRRKQFGAINRQYDSWRRDVSQEDTEQRGPPGNTHVDFSTAPSQLTEKTAPGSGTRAAHGVPSLHYLDEDYHRDSSSMLAEVAIPRVAGVPPTLTNNYKTPYDAAYNYYGNRNPLDLNLPYNQNLPGGMHPSGDFHSHPQRPPTFRPRGHTEASDQHSASPLDGGELPAEKSQQRRERALSYQNALMQQINEKEGRKRREKEEKEQYDVKLEAEMLAYNPWGRSGGGASIKDEKGNLVSDLNQMHKTNEESYRNPVSRKSGPTQSFSMTDAHTPGAEGRAPLSHRLPGFNDKPTPQQLHVQDKYKEDLKQQINEKEGRKRREKEEKEQYDVKLEAEMLAYNPWGRSGGGASIKDEKGNLVSDLNQMHKTNEESYRHPVSRKSGPTQSFSMTDAHTPGAEGRAPLSHRLPGFNDKPTPQQLHVQDRYKEDLKQQIEDNKQKQKEEMERMRIEEEKDEKRLAAQRACIQQEYDKEQRKQKEMQHMKEKAGWIQESKTQHQEEEKRVRQEEESEKKVPESARDREEKKGLLSYEQREPSPPIPTLQRKQTAFVASRPSSVESQFTARTGRSVSAPHSPPVPEKIYPLQDGQQEVIRELSALRKYLRNEQRQLELQRCQTDLQESHYTPSNRPTGRHREAFKSMHKQAVQPSTRSPFSGAAGVNMQNIREFNQLKYRDTASREEVRHMYPDPPTDEQSLDIQQQALLREQQRNIRLMKRKEEHDVLEQPLSHHQSRNKPGRSIHAESTLPSEASFIDVYSGEGPVHQQRRRQPSERHERTTSGRRHDYDWDRNNQPGAQSVQSVTSLHLECKVRDHNQHRITRRDPGDYSCRSEGPSVDEVNVSLLRSALERRVSMETVATEAWLRPGTSDTVKRAVCMERPNSGMDAPPWLTHRVS
ncbi:centrosome and spindle pole associated protein 1 [Cyclopterus lumpus]|uniref:centrosome and spindle pole associated protein 1 n=1 Tax=Cyclopterus lumpus TaxID=8103 RepID=UPI001486614E|nr:centrosome and spindle pole associated protein 1 [Cyclopterus lumpus]